MGNGNGWGGARHGSGRERKWVKVPAAKATRSESESKSTVQAKSFMPSFSEVAALVEASKAQKARERSRDNCPFRIAQHPPRATPKHDTMAMDNALVSNNEWSANAWLAGDILSGTVGEGLLFLGFAYLAELAQRPEYRIISETIATEATRKWIRFKSVGINKDTNKADKDKDTADPDADQDQAADRDLDAEARLKGAEKGLETGLNAETGSEEKRDADKTAKIKELTDFLDSMYVRDRFADIAVQDGFFGRSHLLVDAGDISDEELKVPIGNGRDSFTQGKVGRGFLKGLRTIEAVWTYPQAYNALTPLKPDWYNPQQWYVMGQEIHRTRLLTFVGHPVPDMLKPAYSFGGLSLSQMAKPYVDIWLTTRESVAALIHSFSVMVLMTDLQTMLQPGSSGHGLLSRVAMFNALRDNQGTFVVNKASEDFKNVSASLAGMHELQAQAQEHMTFPARIPLVKFTGIQPSGLNASSEGEIRTFYDTISAYQEFFFRPHLTTIVDIAMITLWGKRDPDIVFEFVPLWSMSEKEEGEVRKIDAETDEIRINSGVVSPEDVRKKVVSDPASKFEGLDPEDVPDLAAEEMAGLMPGKKGMGGGGGGGFGGGGGDDDGEERGGADDAVIPFGLDANWNESDHPRKKDGKFGSGAVSAVSEAKETLADPNFSSSKEMVNKRVVAQGGKPLDDHEIAIARAYMSSGHHAINKAAATPLTATDREIVALFDQALSKLPSYSGATTRVITLTPEQVSGIFVPGELIQWPGYSSAKEGTKAAEGFKGNVELSIESKGGARKFSSVSAFAGREQEVIFGRSAQFKVGTVKKVGTKYKISLVEVPKAGATKPESGGTTARVTIPKSDRDHAELKKRFLDEITEGAGERTEQVPIEKLRATQDTVNLSGGAAGEEDAPIVGVRDKDGNVHIVNGHHRVERAKAKGETSIKARIVDEARMAGDEWNESDHPRGQPGNPGQFGPGGGGGATAGGKGAKKAKGGGKGSGAGKAVSGAPLKIGALAKTGPAMGSNPGGTYKDETGQEFYVKKGKSADHVKNELLAANLFKQVAVGQTLKYRPVEGGEYIASELDKLQKDNVNNFSPTEKKEAQDDFAAHAWLANWDAAGLGGDNIGINSKGEITALDFGGALKYRAQGESKGQAFGNEVTEIDSLRDPSVNKDTAALYGDMTEEQLKASATRVADITDDEIKEAVKEAGFSESETGILAGRLMMRRDDLAKRFKVTNEQFEDGHPRDELGHFKKKDGAEALKTIPGPLDDGTEVNIFQNADGKKFNVVMKDIVSGSTIGTKIVDSMEQAEKIAKEMLGAGPENKPESIEPSSGVFKSKKEHIAHLLTHGTTTAEVLKATGWPSVSMPQQAFGLGMKLVQTKEGGVTKYKGVPMTATELHEAKAAAKAFKQAKQEKGIAAPETKEKAQEAIKAVVPEWKPAPAVPELPKPTPAELEKAKKSTFLQNKMFYNDKDLQNQIDEFNGKYGSKTLSDPAQLAAKVQAYKAIVAKNAEVTAVAEKKVAEQIKNQEAAQKAAAAKEAEEAKAKNAEVIKELGISEAEADGFNALANMLGVKSSEVVKQFKAFEQQAKSYGYPINGFQAALIKNYTNGGYSAINAALRTGSTKLEQHMYVKLMNKALQSMPTYEGTVKRGTDLPSSEQALYKVGYVKEERAFTSTSVSAPWSGNTSFTIKAIGKRGAHVKKLSSHPGEDEVVFSARTFFKVTKVEGSPGGKMHVHMEELEHD